MLIETVIGVAAGGVAIYMIYKIINHPAKLLENAENAAPTPVIDPPEVIEPVVMPDPVITEPVVPEQTRDPLGRFVADDPATPDVNEAWKGGKSPAKKTAKKAPAKPKQPKVATEKPKKARKLKVAK